MPFGNKLLMLRVREFVTEHHHEWQFVLPCKEDTDPLGAADRIGGSLWRTGADVENDEFPLTPPPRFDKGGGNPAVAVHEPGQRCGLRVAQAGPGDRLIKSGQPRLRRHHPARGVSAAA